MLENVDLYKKLDDKEFSKQMNDLIPRMGVMQRLAHEANKPIVVVFEGWDTTCMSKAINDYIRCLDPRGFDLYPMGDPNEAEKARPFMWRFLVKTPVKGRFAIFDRSWYSRTLAERVDGKKGSNVPLRALEEINDFERQLTADNFTIIKFFLHMSKKEHRKRLEKEEKGNSKRCIVTQDGLDRHRDYEKYLPVIDDILTKTDSPNAPWTIIEADDDNYALMRILTVSIDIIKTAVEKMNTLELAPLPEETRYPFGTTTLKNLDLSASFSASEYKEALNQHQQRLGTLQCKLFKEKIPLVVAFEGWDAAGKGGNILRLTENLDPRGYRVVPISAPNDYELSHHYLWRFHIKFPRQGT